MKHHSTVIACRNAAEAEQLRSAIGEASVPVFYKSPQLLNHMSNVPESIIVMTSMILDETAVGLLTKLAIISSVYTIIHARHADNAMNILRLYGCGCHAILGPDESNLLKDLVSPSEDLLDEMVIPPFFIDDDESSLKDPPLSDARPLHVTFLGAQAMMSLSNAALNIHATPSMSFSCTAPSNSWAQEKLVQSMQAYTRWTPHTRPVISGGGITLCQDFNQLASLEPTGQHFVICHGLISEAEADYIGRLPSETRIFTACPEGYTEKSNASRLDAVTNPERLWDVLISSLYPSE